MLLHNPADITEKEFQQISDLVYKHCGINLHEGKKELVRARISKQLRTGGYPTFSAYLEHVLSDKSGQAFADLIDSISTNLTSFFRENQHFDYLREKFLPALIDRKRRAGNHRIRAWSAGCSSGEEPYSIAITCLEALDNPTGWDFKLLATDISNRVLAAARNGIYAKDRVEQIQPLLRSKYFSPMRGPKGDTVYQTNPVLRNVIQFRYLNLMQTWPFSGPFDFIFCRNVMIYFDKPTQQNLINRYWDCLDSGGLLFTGHSESLSGISHQFRYVQPTIYLKP